MSTQSANHDAADWDAVWSERGAAFNAAQVAVPRARDEELAPLVEGLEVRDGHDFLELGPCWGALLRTIRKRHGEAVRIRAVEPSSVHADALPEWVSRVGSRDLVEFDLPDRCVDRVGVLAVLHHCDTPAQVIKESYRVLRPGGRLGIADVGTGSTVAEWLNGFVARNNPLGHDGRFFDSGEFTSWFKDAGFTTVREFEAEFVWRFRNIAQMVDYCRTMFWLKKATRAEVRYGLESILGVESDSKGARLRWSLTYAFGER